METMDLDRRHADAQMPNGDEGAIGVPGGLK